MKHIPGVRSRGFTLIELLVALIILSLLALMSYRGLDAVLDSREYVKRETGKWRRVTLFLARFERDVRLAAPRPVRSGAEIIPAWHAKPGASQELASPYLEFSRFGSTGREPARRVAYRLNDKQEIELWLWPGLDPAPHATPRRYPLLKGIKTLELHYLGSGRVWKDAWPDVAGSPVFAGSSIPQAVRLRMVLVSGEEIVRIFR
ncbi:MAG: type II secretion system minor pseudopilin GspJ [Betaproteobacteria bacterium]|nr:type II secretion system minor pseudopilin GspJ [Betaproteobacteria bacterium]